MPRPNASDVTQAGDLLHGDKIAALGDAGYQGVVKREENLGKTVIWHVAMKHSKRKALPNNKLGRMREKLEVLKASMRAKVAHPFHVLKNLLRHRKTRYRALAKNTAQLLPCSASPIWCSLAGGLRYPKPEVRPER
jgi:IS5 family transposase